MDESSESLYRELFVEHPAVKLLVCPDTLAIVDANHAAAEFYGYSRDALVDSNFTRISSRPADEIIADIKIALRGERRHFHFRHRLASGIVKDIDLQCGPMHFRGRLLLHMLVHDVTEQQRNYEQLLSYREIYERLPVAFYRATPGPTGRFLEFNQAFMRMLEAESREALLDLDVSSIYVDPSHRSQFSEALLCRDKLFRHELHLRTIKGKAIWVADTAFRHVNEGGQEVFDGVMEDITDRKRLEQELERRATRDELTGLYNRGHASTQLDHEIQRIERYDGELGAVMFDLDEFKNINDTFGHPTGDNVLRQIGELIRSAIRELDLPARWGGEEFLILMPSTNERGAAQMAEKLRVMVSNMRFAAVGRVTLSAGSADYRRGEGEEAFLRRLDRALYAAKGGGRDRVEHAV